MKNITDYLSKHTNGKLLAILPHTDDASFVAGGLFQELQKLNIETRLVCLTGTKTEVSELEFANILGIDSVNFLNYAKGNLNKDTSKLTEDLKNEIKNFAPNLVLTFDPHGVTGHPDHAVSSIKVLDVVKKLNNKPELLWRIADDQERKYFDKGHDIHLSITPSFKLNLSLSQSIKKLKAIFSHKDKFKSLIFKMQVLEWYLFDHKEYYYLVDTKKDNFKIIISE